MEEQLISFETAKLAKEKGFDILCNTIIYTDENNNSYKESLHSTLINEEFENFKRLYYKYPHRCLSIPTQSLLQKWLRDKHNYYITVDNFNGSQGKFSAFVTNKNGGEELDGFTFYDTYEEALEEGLQETLKILK